MLKNLLSNNPIFGALVCVLVFVAGGLLYLNAVNRQPPKDPIIIYKPVEVEKKPKPPPPGETFETGHWHGDEWHTGSHDAHAQVTTPEGKPGTPVDAQSAQPVNAHIGAPMPDGSQIPTTSPDPSESSAPSQEAGDLNRAWVEWGRKYDELAEKFLQAAGEDTALLPTTKEEQEQFDNDPEWQRRYSEALHKTAKIYGMMKALEKEQPLRP